MIIHRVLPGRVRPAPRTFVPRPPAAPLLVLVLALAGCGTGTGAATTGSATGSAGPSASPSGNAQILAVYRELNQCLRRHGAASLPDPVVDPATGRVQLPPGTRKPPVAAMNACKSILNRLPASASKRPKPSASDMAKLRLLAKCMREHGLRDWPDPNADGDFPLPQRLLSLGKKGMASQIQACKQHYPNGQISIVEPGATRRKGNG